MTRFGFSISRASRKQAAKDEDEPSIQELPTRTKTKSKHHRSKAQKILGTGSNINVDMNNEARHPPSRASNMSFAVSEMTVESLVAPSDHESGVFPRHGGHPVFRSRYADEVITRVPSSTRTAPAPERFSSKLPAHYVRQVTPPAIAQQTSDSSARDLALRKGLPPVIPLRPLDQASLSRYDVPHLPPATTSRQRRISKLDISHLFSKSSRHAKGDAELPLPPTRTPTQLRRPEHHKREKNTLSVVDKLMGPPASGDHASSALKESRYNMSGAKQPLKLQATHSVHMVHERPKDPATSTVHVKSTPIDVSMHMHLEAREPTSSRRTQATSTTTMGTSIASHNSKGSRGSRLTGSERFTNTNLQKTSVLSLSSESESDEPAPASEHKARSGDPRPRSSKTRQTSSNVPPLPSQPRPRSQKQMLAPSHSVKSQSSRNGASKATACVTIPETCSTRSEPLTERQSSSPSAPARIRSTSSPKAAVTALRPTPNPTSSQKSKRDSSHSSRMMVVTRREEALLEALRTKRARMREEIMDEMVPVPVASTSTIEAPVPLTPVPDKTKRTPPRVPSLQIPTRHDQIDYTAEPSPDLSDFLTFGSDDDSTPRSSWAPPTAGGGHTRAHRGAPQQSRDNFSPKTPPSAARLSAVGMPDLQQLQTPVHPMTLKRASNGVRFVEDGTHLNPHDDFLLDDREVEGPW